MYHSLTFLSCFCFLLVASLVPYLFFILKMAVACSDCERSEQSLTKGERPGQTKTNWWPKMSIRKYLEWRVSQQVSTVFPQNLRFRWGLIAFTLIWAKAGVFIQIFTIILEYKNWAANTWCKSLEHRVDEYARKYFWYCAVCNYGVDRSL